MKNHKLSVFGVLLIYLLSVANAFNIFWCYWLVSEQIFTGWGYGTNMDILVLVPWIIQIACIPIAITTIVYFVISYIFSFKRKALITNIVLFSVLILQSVLINLFIWY